MRIKEIEIREYKRFKNLVIKGVPETARLVVLAGPNGFGKSSLFDALLTWYKNHSQLGVSRESLYYKRFPAPDPHLDVANDIHIEFFGAQFPTLDDHRRCFRIRSAYRNEADFTINAISKQPRSLDQLRFNRMIDNDISVSQNYIRMMGRALHVLTKDREKTGNQVLGDVFDTINPILANIFGDLSLTDLGNPSENGSFYFTKGTSKNFHYKNLSAGEKAAFDILLDIVLSKEYFHDTIYCIDEPEIHLNTKVQGKLLEELLKLLPSSCQLWVATHAIGMMRYARDLWSKDEQQVCFLDFSGLNLDEPQIIEPARPDRKFWDRTLAVALDDLSSLVAPKTIIVCEGAPRGSPQTGINADHDAQCYNAIFGNSHPEALFISGGNASEVISDHYVLVAGLTSTISGAEVKRLIDRDARAPMEIADLKQKGIRVLSERHIEGYLFSEEILTKLCSNQGADPKILEVLEARSHAIKQILGQSKPEDDLKSAAGLIYVEVKKILSLHAHGNSARAFMRETLAPLVTPETNTYQKMSKDIFG